MRSHFRAVLIDFQRNAISIQDFQKWLLENLQTFLDSGDSALIEAANILDADLVEFGEHIIDRNELLRNVDVCIETLGPADTITTNKGGIFMSSEADLYINFKARERMVSRPESLIEVPHSSCMAESAEELPSSSNRPESPELQLNFS